MAGVYERSEASPRESKVEASFARVSQSIWLMEVLSKARGSAGAGAGGGAEGAGRAGAGGVGEEFFLAGEGPGVRRRRLLKFSRFFSGSLAFLTRLEGGVVVGTLFMALSVAALVEIVFAVVEAVVWAVAHCWPALRTCCMSASSTESSGGVNSGSEELAVVGGEEVEELRAADVGALPATEASMTELSDRVTRVCCAVRRRRRYVHWRRGRRASEPCECSCEASDEAGLPPQSS